MKDRYLAVAGFANDMQYCDTLEKAQEFLGSYFIEPKEGYHPDAETCFIYELKSKAYVYSENEGKSFKHKFIDLRPTKKGEIKSLLLSFFAHRQESVTCDECGDKGTGVTFDELYQKINPNP